MRLSELMGTSVHDRTGARVGGVADVVLVKDGPAGPSGRSAYRVASLILVEGRHTRMLGYDEERRPAVFRRFVQRMAKSTHTVPWEYVESVTPDRVTLKVDRAQLTPRST